MSDKKYCLNCGSLLGLDCGDAEPDYNENYCSKGCYQVVKVIDIGDFVCCDFCNSDGEDSHGGVMVGSNAVCGICCEKNGYYKSDYKYKGEIGEFFPKDKTFKETVLEYLLRTTASKSGEITIQSF